SEQNGLQDLLESVLQRNVTQGGRQGRDEADPHQGDERLPSHRQRAHAIDRSVARSQIGERGDRRITERVAASVSQPTVGEEPVVVAGELAVLELTALLAKQQLA